MFEPGACQLQEFGDTREIPVRVVDVDVAEVRRKGSDGLIEILALLIPLEEPARGERVA